MWQRYADLWSSTPAARAPELNACLSVACVYCDPNGEVRGRPALADYMEGFRQSMPGTRFCVATVAAHNARTLSEWALLAADGSVLQTGRSFAVHDEQGRLREITGFFDEQPMGARIAV
jgi:hypothetical protein